MRRKKERGKQHTGRAPRDKMDTEHGKVCLRVKRRVPDGARATSHTT
jgi:hypothetical protein